MGFSDQADKFQIKQEREGGGMETEREAQRQRDRDKINGSENVVVDSAHIHKTKQF